MKSLIITIFILLTLITFGKDISSLKNDIESEYYSFNIKRHNGLIKELKKIENLEVKNYYLALEFHTLGKIVYNKDKDLALKYFEYSISSINKSISNRKHQSMLPEYYAILSSALGKKSSLSGLSAVYWGYKAKDAFDKGFELDSNNHKVRLIGAIHLMHVPEILGGDKKRARATLENLLNLKSEPRTNFEINWAEKPEIFAYLAQIDILEKNFNSKYIDSALKYQPNYDFVNIDLYNQTK